MAHGSIPPGYFESSCVAKLAEELQEASPKWSLLGIHLGLAEADLPQESAAEVNKCFMDMLTHSLRNPPEYPYKRRILFKAVDHVDHSLALTIKQEYDNEKELDIKDLASVMEDLNKLQSRWRELGGALEIQQPLLDTFCPKEDHKIKFVKVLRDWMDKKAYDATLTKLYHALNATQFKGLAERTIRNQVVIGLLQTPGQC